MGCDLGAFAGEPGSGSRRAPGAARRAASLFLYILLVVIVSVWTGALAQRLRRSTLGARGRDGRE